MSGKLDPQTPNKIAKSLLSVLVGTKKELVAFEYASHYTVMTANLVAGDPSGETCGMKLLASYIRKEGDLNRLDRSCVDEMPAFNLTIPDVTLHDYFSTEDAYDGEYSPSWTS
ncbi:unnamed protein product [Phytophthora lilii]|uniref:Unnamed protein product n=1 Tax=Phytophthora lilii TaxID=2077276 RepID=A0A9W6WZ99_9STRA|nr:unnamed protein product [Phytophthora lilii]